MTPVDFAQLPFAARAGLWWAVFWRGLALTVAWTLVGSVVAGVAGAMVAMSGLPARGMAVVGGVVGVLTGGVAFYLLLRWLLAARLGAFRLVLVREGGPQAPAA